MVGGLHRGGGGSRRPQLEHWGGGGGGNFGIQYKGVPKSPLLSLFCNSVYWLKPHNNVNSRPPNLAVLPSPLNGGGGGGDNRIPVYYLNKLWNFHRYRLVLHNSMLHLNTIMQV